MRMELDDNEALRSQGWRVFRSSSRDRVIPASGLGAQLKRIKIHEAFPVASVGVGAEAVGLEERSERARDFAERGAAAVEVGADRPLGLTQYIPFAAWRDPNIFAITNGVETSTVIGIAPFDGFLSELLFAVGGVGTMNFAIRSSGGQTMFTAIDDASASALVLSLAPDFTDIVTSIPAGVPTTLRNLRMPVFAGEELTFVSRIPLDPGAGTQLLNGILGFESFVLAPSGTKVAASQFLALTAASREGAREAGTNANRLAVERERTERVRLETESRREVARLAVEARQVGQRNLTNPFNNVLLSESALRQLASRSAPRAPAPRVPAPPRVPLEGAGKTFVGAWNPSFGSIGYLIPDPPRGGRVNVFDSKYTIWDISGRNVGSGQIVPVRSDGDIPPGARLSQVARGRAPGGLLPATGPGSTEF